MSTFKIEAILDGVTPLKDGGVSLRFHTNEVATADKVMLLEFYQSFGWLLFNANAIQDSEIPKEQAKPEAGVSPSKRLYGVLFVYWKQLGSKGDFDAFYKQQMEKFIERVKENLA